MSSTVCLVALHSRGCSCCRAVDYLQPAGIHSGGKKNKKKKKKREREREKEKEKAKERDKKYHPCPLVLYTNCGLFSVL